MTDSPSSILLLRLQSTGSNTNLWGGYLNTSMQTLERASKGYQAYTITGDATLSWSNYSASNDLSVAYVKFNGTPAAAWALTYPGVQNFFGGWNNSGQTGTLKNSGGTGIAIPTGRKALLYGDATDIGEASPNWLSNYIPVLANAGDIVVKTTLETAIANAGLPATAGTVLNSAADTTAGYLTQKITVSGALTKSTTNSGGNEALNISVGDGGLSIGGLQLASFTAVAGFSYTAPVGGTVTLPTPTGSLRKIELTIFGFGSTALSGLINGASTFFMDGDQTETLTDASASRGWV